MKLFKNSVGSPSNLTIRRRRNFLICMIVILGVLLCFTVTYTVKYFSIAGTEKNISSLPPVVPVFTSGNSPTQTIKPVKTIKVDLTKNVKK